MENPLENTAIQVTYGKPEGALDFKQPLQMPVETVEESEEDNNE